LIKELFLSTQGYLSMLSVCNRGLPNFATQLVRKRLIVAFAKARY